MKQDKLQKIANYAKANNISTTWVYKLIKAGKLKCTLIDGIKFIQHD